MRHLRHQPLLVWTIGLVLLLLVAGVGLAGGDPGETPVRINTPAATTGGAEAETLLGHLAQMHPALAGDPAPWLAQAEELVERGTKAAEGTVHEARWQQTAERLSSLTARAEDDPRERLSAIETYTAAVMDLRRGYRP